MDPQQDCEAARRELVRGQQLMSQLRSTLIQRDGGPKTAAEVLMDEISVSLNRALTALNCSNSKDDIIASDPHRFSPTPNTNREEHVQKILTSKPMQDGYSWKKYGQKSIAGSTHPRCYFKCIRRKDEGCKAQKQVQQVEGDSIKFLVTYICQHTCSASVDASSPPNQCFLSFGSSSSNDEQVQNWSVATNRQAQSDPVTAGTASELISPSPNPSDTDSMLELLESDFNYENGPYNYPS